MPELLRDGPANARMQVVLAHGAGAGMRSPFMQAVAEGLAAHGLSVVRFEFPYMAKRGAETRFGAPDKQDVLLATWRKVVAELGGGAHVIVSGKSLGGRMASLVADELGARGLLCFGYPFHPPGQPKKLRTAHLATLRTPALIVQGTRDSFGTREEIAGYTLSPSIELCFIEDGDHSLSPRKKSGHDPAAALQTAVDAAAAFAKRVMQG